MIRFVCREKLCVSSPLLECTCHVNLISRMDSDSNIQCEKRVVKTPQGHTPATAKHISGSKKEYVFHVELKLMSKGTRFCTLVRGIYLCLSKDEQTQSGFYTGQQFKEVRSDIAVSRTVHIFRLESNQGCHLLLLFMLVQLNWFQINLCFL